MSLFTKGPKGPSIYGSSSGAAIGEPDLRAEVTAIIEDEKRGRFIIYRRMRRDSSGNLILSEAAKENRSNEATYGVNESEKYLFDDHIVKGYINERMGNHEAGRIVEYGDSRTDDKGLYLEYDVLSRITGDNFDMPDEHDKILVPKYDINGNLSSPMRVAETYDIGSVQHYRLDALGRIEYYRIKLLSKFDKNQRL